MEYFADLHVHIGRAKNRPVKITASKKLTFSNILDTCVNQKGIDIVGIVDCACPFVLMEITELMESSQMVELPRGGLLYNNQLTVILGAEIETNEEGGAAHSIAYFPYVKQMQEFSRIMSGHITNISLSSQRARLQAKQLLEIVKQLGGQLVPAHVFTPFKSFYGRCYDRLSEAFGGEFDSILAVELGLSADTNFADRIKELSSKTYLTNSDAHSLNKIGREYNKLRLEKPDFESLFLAFRGDQANCLEANFGLNPELGKYHRTFCKRCGYIANDLPPITECPRCNSQDVTLGVLDRISFISDYEEPKHPSDRPPYYYQIPLEFIPGIGKRTIEKLILNFGSEMNVLHKADLEQLTEVVGVQIAERIIQGRRGKLQLKVGGGGFYGRIL